jgi:predicted AAA+ superfamily ATPase
VVQGETVHAVPGHCRLTRLPLNFLHVFLESLLSRAEPCWRAWKPCCRMRPLAPDWSASVAFRYRKRGGAGALEPVRHVAGIRLPT